MVVCFFPASTEINAGGETAKRGSSSSSSSKGRETERERQREREAERERQSVISEA